jgi:hypothetical protein
MVQTSVLGLRIRLDFRTKVVAETTRAVAEVEACNEADGTDEGTERDEADEFVTPVTRIGIGA